MNKDHPRWNGVVNGITWRRWGGVAGMIGPVHFVAIFLIEGWLRPGYDPIRMYVSELALGARGWIQIANFLVYGVLLLLLARGIATEFMTGPASRAGPILLILNGIRTIGVGLFVTDPAATPLQAMSWHSTLHLWLAVSAFVLWPLTCFVFYRRFRVDPNWRPLAGWTLCTGIATAVLSSLLIVGSAPLASAPNALNVWLGLIQRTSIITFSAWQFAVAWRLWRHHHNSTALDKL